MSNPDHIREVVKICLIETNDMSATFRVRLRGENYWYYYEFKLFRGQDVIFHDGGEIDTVPKPVTFTRELRSELTDLEVISKTAIGETS